MKTYEVPVSLASIDSSINKKFKNLSNHPLEPKSFDEINLTEFKTQDGNDFYQHKLKTNNTAALIFYDLEAFKRLCESNEIVVDGTFSSVPELFYQLFTIHYELGGFFHSSVYILMNNKTQASYDIVLEQLVQDAKKLDLNFRPQFAHTDFEKAIINSIKNKIQPERVIGCYFHYSQAIMKKINDVGLKSKYSTNPKFKIYVKMWMALAFLPQDQIKPTAKELIQLGKNSDLIDDNFQKFIDYHQRTWSGESSLFKTEDWSVYKLENRTSNPIEG